MQIEEQELRELLNKGALSYESKKFPIDSLLSTIGFVISACLAQFYLQAIWIKVLFWIFVGTNLIYSLVLLCKYIKNKYSSEDFIKDIKTSSKVRNFSLIVIKDTTGLNRGKYLLRYDRRWKCYLLPYQNTHENNDADFVLKTVIDTYQFSNLSITASKTDDITKYSFSDNMTKNYHHTFYYLETVTENSSIQAKKSFKLNGEKFKWMSIDEMKRNKTIMSKNSETVNFIAKNF